MLDAIIKIGGSILSDKNTGELKLDMLQGITRQLTTLYQQGYSFMVLTGVGYHGHYPVKTFSLHKGLNGKEVEQLIGLNTTQLMVNELRNTLLRVFEDNKLPAFMFYASSMFHINEKQVKGANINALRMYLNYKVIPVITGDLVYDENQSDIRVLSADTIATYLASKFKTNYLIHLTDVPGVYTKNPKTHSDAKFLPLISVHDISRGMYELNEANSIDVSGAMWKKTHEISHAISLGVVKQGIIAGYSDTILLDLVRSEHVNPASQPSYTLIR